jgi:hypothetical protein
MLQHEKGNPAIVQISLGCVAVERFCFIDFAAIPVIF